MLKLGYKWLLSVTLQLGFKLVVSFGNARTRRLSVVSSCDATTGLMLEIRRPLVVTSSDA